MGDRQRTPSWVLPQRLARWTVRILLVLLPVVWGGPVRARSHGASPSPRAKSPESAWSQVDRLITAQRLQEGVKLLQKMQKAAQTAERESEASRAAIRLAQLRMTLSNYEMAVTVLHDQMQWQAQRPSGVPGAAPVPATEQSRALLAMFYAQALTTYAQAYSSQVNPRERSPEPAGPEVPFVNALRTWTRAELCSQAQAALVTAWELRAVLGSEPTTALPEFVVPGTLPARSTLRELLTYQYVELLANRRYWRPDQSVESVALDVAALDRLDAQQATAERLLDEETHPLTKLAAVLGDLAAWHQTMGRSAAALEAKRERLVRLHQALPDATRRAQVRAQLAELVQATGELPQAANAQAALATMLRSDYLDHPDRAAPGQLTRAYAIAAQGAQRFPDSPGGKRCQALVQALTGSEFHLDSMAVDGAGRRSLRVWHRNLPVLHFRAYKYDPVQRLLAGSADAAAPTEQKLAALLRSGQKVAAWTTTLPQTPDLQAHVTFVTPPLGELGSYLIIASAGADFALANNQLESVRLQLSDVVLWATEAPTGVRVTAVSGRTGEPLAGVELAVYQVPGPAAVPPRPGATLVHRARTGADGSAELPSPESDLVVVARRGADLALLEGVPAAESEGGGDEPGTLVYTDRRVYRPLQKVLWKVVAYRSAGGRSRLPSTAARAVPVVVTLLDPDFQRVLSATVTTNQFGSASGEFTLPAGRRLGSWRLTTSHGGESVLKVEPASGPRFTAMLMAPEAPLRLGQPTALRGQASYLSGAPVRSGKVRWRVMRTAELPTWFEPLAGRSRNPPDLAAAGEAAVHADGTFVVGFTPEALPAHDRRAGEETIYHLAVAAELADDSGEKSWVQRSFPVGAVAMQAEIGSEREFARSGEPSELWVTRRDLDGNPLPGGASWRLLRLPPELPVLPPAELPHRGEDRPDRRGAAAGEPAPPDDFSAATPGDRLRPRTDPGYAPRAQLHERPDGPEQAHGELTHGPDGRALLRLAGLPAGVYRLQYRSHDALGRSYLTSRELVVVPGPTPTPDAIGLPALLLRERPLVRVGETARFALASGVSGQALFVEVHRAGVLSERRLLHAGREPLLLELPVGPADRGEIRVTLTAVLDHQLLHLEQRVSVSADDRALQVAVAALHDPLRPGAKETVRVTVKTATGEPPAPGTTELLAYMYDRSREPLTALAQSGLLRPELAGPDPLRRAAPEAAPHVVHNLIRGPAEWRSAEEPADDPGGDLARPDALRLRLNFGLRGPAVRAAGETTAPKRRTELDRRGDGEEGDPGERGEAAEPPGALPPLADPAFFLPHLLLGPDGQAAIEFTVPESATPWTVVVAALATDWRRGSVLRQAESRYELVVRPHLPRFLREGDRAELEVVVSSTAPRAVPGQLRMELVDAASGADVSAAFGLPATPVPLRLPAGGSATARFSLTAPRQPTRALLRVRATAGEASATAQRLVPVLPGRLWLTRSRSVTLKGHDHLDFSKARSLGGPADPGDPAGPSESLVLTVDAEPATAVLAALPALAQETSAGVEPTLNRFLATSLVAATLRQNPVLSRLLTERPASLGSPGADLGIRPLTPDETSGRGAAPVVPRGPGEFPGNDVVDGAPDGEPVARSLELLQPPAVEAARAAGLAQLRAAQTDSGGWAFWPGGPPSPHLTLSVVMGLGRAAELGVAVPTDLGRNAWRYLGDQFRERYGKPGAEAGPGGEYLTQLNFAAATAPSSGWVDGALSNAERQLLLQLSLRNATQLPPLLQAQLALTLARMGQADEGVRRLTELLATAQTSPAEGTIFAGTARAGRGPSDAIAGQAMVLRALQELLPADPRRAGLVQWLLQQRPRWQSARTTVGVLDALCQYLGHRAALGEGQAATVTVRGSGPPRSVRLELAANRLAAGPTQVFVPAVQLTRATEISVEHTGPGVALATATYRFRSEPPPGGAATEPLSLSRRYYLRRRTGRESVLTPIGEQTPVYPGDQLEVQLTLRSQQPAQLVQLRDPAAAGGEPVEEPDSPARYLLSHSVGYYREVRASGTNFFVEELPAGEYTFSYRLRASTAGTFRVPPAVVQTVSAPEWSGYSASATVTVLPAPPP